MPQLADMERGFRWLLQPSLSLEAAHTIDERALQTLGWRVPLGSCAPSARIVPQAGTPAGRSRGARERQETVPITIRLATRSNVRLDMTV